MEAAAWNWLEGFWDRHAKDKAYQSSRTHEEAKQERREATELEAIALQAKRLRGNSKAYNALNLLLGMSLSPMRSRVDHEAEKRLKAEISEYDAQER
jgi:hypothetical protein